MAVSVFDLFKIGIGPSSSHTMGPMTAACRFIREVEERGQLAQVARVTVDLYGSLALTGKGHSTDTAVTLGLAGWLPAQVDPDVAAKLIDEVRQHGKLLLAGSQSIEFRIDRDIHWHYKESLPYHPNALTLRAYDAAGATVHEGTFYSVGGGFVVTEAEAQSPTALVAGPAIPFPFENAAELLAIAEREKVRIAECARTASCPAVSTSNGARSGCAKHSKSVSATRPPMRSSRWIGSARGRSQSTRRMQQEAKSSLRLPMAPLASSLRCCGTTIVTATARRKVGTRSC
jgi:iron-sulfur-dependent L-serine dehydratase single chain form